MELSIPQTPSLQLYGQEKTKMATAKSFLSAIVQVIKKFNHQKQQLEKRRNNQKLPVQLKWAVVVQRAFHWR